MMINHRLTTFVLAIAVGVAANFSMLAEASEKPRHGHAKERKYDHSRRHQLEHKHAKRHHQYRHREHKRDSRHHVVRRHHRPHRDHHFVSGFVLGSVVGHAFGGRDTIRHSDRIHFVRDYDGQCFRVEQGRYRDVWVEVDSYKCGERRYY